MIKETLADASDKMDKAVGHFQDEFSSIRTGRAAPALVEKIPVDYYGSEVPLQQIAGFSILDARTLVIQPYDKNSIGAIDKALQESDLGINPANDGQVIRLAFPPLTEERRKELVKVVKSQAEEARISVRNVRRGARQDLEGWAKEGEISEDELDRAEKELDRLTQAHTDRIDELLEHKEKELLEV